MTINTQKLREAAANAKALTAEDLIGFRLTATAHITGLARAIESCCDHIDAQTTEIARLRDGIEEAIRLLGMDRPINPTDTLSRALLGETHD